MSKAEITSHLKKFDKEKPFPKTLLKKIIQIRLAMLSER